MGHGVGLPHIWLLDPGPPMGKLLELFFLPPTSKKAVLNMWAMYRKQLELLLKFSHQIQSLYISDLLLGYHTFTKYDEIMIPTDCLFTKIVLSRKNWLFNTNCEISSINLILAPACGSLTKSNSSRPLIPRAYKPVTRGAGHGF